MKLIDSHCHIDFPEFAQDFEEVIANASLVGVEQFVIPGVQASQWQSLIEFCNDNPSCHYALGIHPYFLDSFQEKDLALLEKLLQKQCAVAVGECGIDSNVDNILLQQQIFESQVALANKFKKPIIIHHRKSHHLIMQSFKKVKPKYGGVIHAFSGSLQDAKKYVQLGFKLGIGGVITYERAKKTRSVVARVPLEHLVLETDSPDMPLSGRQGERNEPKYMPEVLKHLSRLKGLPPKHVAEQTYLNAKYLFSIKS